MRRILVCLDDSPRAALVLSAGLDLALRTGAKVRLFRAVGLVPHLSPELAGAAPGDVPKALLDGAERELGELGRTMPGALFKGVTTRIGQPWEAICAAAREQDADLIVIGSHGYGAIDRVLGTTAAKVVNHADRSVMVVRSKPG